MTGSVAGAAVRSVDVWVRAYEAQQDTKEVEALRRKLAQLEKELKAVR